MIVEEVWAEIQGFPDYAVSNHGRVMSTRFGKILTPRVNSYGSYRVVLYRDRKPYDFYVHRLVAAAFIDGYKPELQVKPRDEDYGNSNVYNLRFSNGARMGQLVKSPPPAKLRRVMIKETGHIFGTINDCAEYIGGHVSSIYRVLRGERPSHLGYTFAYVEET
jgi:hypothetical protein